MPKTRPKSKICPEHVAMEEKKAEAMRLVSQGYRLPEIARRLGYAGPQGAHNLIHRTLKAMVEQPREEARAVMVAKLDHWLQRLLPQLEEGDPKAISLALKIEERRARLLGLDAPVAVHTPNGDPLVQFVVHVPVQAPSLADWQAQAAQIITVKPEEVTDGE